MPCIAVLIPCWNEALTIEKVVTDFRAVLPEADIYVYDNNSTDGTAEIAKKAGAIVVHEYRQGKGNVIRSMFRDIEADCYVMTDGDDTYPAEAAREMTIHALDKNLLLMQVPVSYRDRPAGSVSKLDTFRDGARVLKTIFMLYKDYRPLHFFLAAALILTLISLSLFLPVFHEYLATGLVPKMPTLVTSGFFMVAAVISTGIGLVLDTEVKNARKNLEIQMNMIRMFMK